MATMKANPGMSPAVQDLGLGSQISQQMQDDEEERKKKLLKSARSTQMGAAAQSLLGTGAVYG